ncbi:MAG TPA: glycosyltransferase [Waddliaceae bacterium]
MRILILTAFFPPTRSIATERLYSWAKYWAMEGHEIVVVTPSVQDEPLVEKSFSVISVPQVKFLRKLKSSFQNEQRGSSHKSSFRFASCFFRSVRQKYGILNACRMPDFLDLWSPRAWKKLSHLKPFDAVVSSCGPYTMHLLARRMKKRGLVHYWVADFRDLWVDNHIYPGLFPFTYIENILEKKIAGEANLLTTVSDPLVEQLKKRHPQAKVECIRNGFDPENYHQLPQNSFFQDPSKFRVVYTGKIYPNKRKVDYLFEAVASLPEALKERLELHFCVDVPQLIQEQIERWNAAHWVWNHGFVPRTQSLHMQRDADLLLFLEWEDETKEGNVSGKIYEYFYMNKPILSIGGSTQSTTAQWLKESGAHTCGRDINSIKSLIVSMLSKEKGSCKIEAWRPEYHRQFQALKLLNFISDV